MSTILGLEADFRNNTFTRLGAAVGKNAGADFDRYPMYGGRRRCNLTDDGKVTAYYGDPAYTETGKLTQVVTVQGTKYLIGTCVQVMVEQPKFYYRVEPLDLEPITGSPGYHLRKARYWISDAPQEGFRLHPAFVCDGLTREKIYLSAYEGCRYYTILDAYFDDIGGITFTSEMLGSVAGYTPLSGQIDPLTRANARTLAHGRGTGWELTTAASAACSQLLMVIEYAGFDLQAVLGKGITGLSGTDTSTNHAAKTGVTSLLGNRSGMAEGTDAQAAISYRGEENFWGNIGQWLDGVIPNGDTGTFYLADHDFSDNVTAESYWDSGLSIPTASGFVSAFGYSEKCDWLFVPSETRSDSVKTVGDAFHGVDLSDGTNLSVALGADWQSGAEAGPFYWDQTIVSGGQSAAIGARLAYFPKARWVYDRTQSDLEQGTAKGHYNASDLNRVGKTMREIALWLKECGYDISISSKTYWKISDIPTQSQMKQYLDDLAALRRTIPLLSSTPEAPSDMDGLTWQEANDIERILYDIDLLLSNMEAAWYYSGETFCGEVTNND